MPRSMLEAELDSNQSLRYSRSPHPSLSQLFSVFLPGSGARLFTPRMLVGSPPDVAQARPQLNPPGNAKVGPLWRVTPLWPLLRLSPSPPGPPASRCWTPACTPPSYKSYVFSLRWNSHNHSLSYNSVYASVFAHALFFKPGISLPPLLPESSLLNFKIQIKVPSFSLPFFCPPAPCWSRDFLWTSQSPSHSPTPKRLRSDPDSQTMLRTLVSARGERAHWSHLLIACGMTA